MSDLIGRTIGQYRVVEQLGMGGMATVYKAYQPAMDRYVALKIPPDYLTRDPNFRTRFIREARTLAHLEHPHILPVYDFGEEDGIPFIVMRYVDGGTLRELMARGPLPLDQTVRLVREVAEALGYAHRQGVTHRDVKPANVLLDHNGAALLTDFGIAKILDENTELTGTGIALGTPQYMAPEQVQGKPVDARTDIYSLGVVLYEAATGRRPFAAETPLALAMMHVSESLPLPRQVNPAVPEGIERIILRALAKDPADRFQTAEELASALASWTAAASTIPIGPSPATDPTVPLPVANGASVAVAPAGSEATHQGTVGLVSTPTPVMADQTIVQAASDTPVKPMVELPQPPFVAPLSASPPLPARRPGLPRPAIFAAVGVVAIVVVAGVVFLGGQPRAPIATPAASTPPVVGASPTSPSSPAVFASHTSVPPTSTSAPSSPTAAPSRTAAGEGTPAPNTWTTRQRLPADRSNLAAVAGPDGRIYAIGGFRSQPLDSVEVYTPSTNRWTTVAKLPTARYGLAAVTGPDGRIYAIGGYNTTSLSTVEVYSPGTNSWATVASMPTARQELAAASGPDGRIYALGGSRNGTVVNAVEAYAPSTNTWTAVASLPVGRDGLAAVVGADGRIYAIGGGPEATAAVEAYTPSTNSWTSVASMPVTRTFLAAASGLDGRIYAIGGTNGTILRSVDVYTPSTNRWTTVASMPTARYGLAAAADSEGHIYALGGRDAGGLLALVDLYEPASLGGPTPTP